MDEIELKMLEYLPGYGISSTGQIWSYKTNKWIKPAGKRYLHITIYQVDKTRKSFDVHRLVADAWIENPLNKPGD